MVAFVDFLRIQCRSVIFDRTNDVSISIVLYCFNFNFKSNLNPPKKIFSRRGRFEQSGKRAEIYKPRSDSFLPRKSSDEVQRKGKGSIPPITQSTSLVVPVSQNINCPKEMGQIGIGNTVLDVSVVVHEHGETQFGGQDLVGDVSVKQVDSNLGSPVICGPESTFLITVKPSVTQLACGPEEQLRIGPVEVSRSDRNLAVGDNLIGPFDGFTFGSISNKTLKAKAGIWKRAARKKSVGF
ncbi:hypothetical protein Q3G72_033211 [Acer saccharum]|nr:hypothetical protein Q3G72_033211 [Acer saccharum]